jgi:hypothetical protein
VGCELINDKSRWSSLMVEGKSIIEMLGSEGREGKGKARHPCWFDFIAIRLVDNQVGDVSSVADGAYLTSRAK